MNFQEAVASGFRNYSTFTGRAARSEFWYWVLFTVLAGIATSTLDFAFFPSIEILPINTITNLVLLLPNLAVSVRRLHDTDRTGWWVLLALTIIGNILLLVWYCLRGTTGPNRFGADPLENE